MPDVKCTVVGDTESNRTEVIFAYQTGKRASDHSAFIATVYTEQSVTQIVGGEQYTLHIHDTNPSEDYAESRPLGYQTTDVFLVFFSVISPSSLQSVKEKWVPEIRQHCPGTPFILVGTEIELRQHPEIVKDLAKDSQNPLTRAQGKQLAKRLRAHQYMECSANTLEGVKEVFQDALLIGRSSADSRMPVTYSKCVIM